MTGLPCTRRRGANVQAALDLRKHWKARTLGRTWAARTYTLQTHCPHSRNVRTYL